MSNEKYIIKAGALQVTLFVAIVIALLLTAFILLVHLQKKITVDGGFVHEVIENTNNGIEYTLVNTVQLGDTVTIDLKNESYKSLKVHRTYWGVFEKMTSTSKIKSKTFKKAALIGGAQPKNRLALNVSNIDLPLSLVGNTKIIGDAYIPRRGIKPGYINNISYQGSKLIYGTTRNSFGLPSISQELKENIKSLKNTIDLIDNDQIIELENKIFNSFLEPTKLIFNNSEIVLNNHNLIGNIIVVSKTKILIDNNSKLKDIILVAPVIEISNSVKGSFQAIASENINVGEKCSLNYPTALILLPKEDKALSNFDDDNNATIKVNEGSKIEGIVAYIGDEGLNNNKAQIKIENEALVAGEIYCSNNLELLGSVDGTVYTRNFILNAFGSIYQNYIYNARISIDILPQEYVGLAFKNSKKKVALWLY